VSACSSDNVAEQGARLHREVIAIQAVLKCGEGRRVVDERGQAANQVARESCVDTPRHWSRLVFVKQDNPVFGDTALLANEWCRKPRDTHQSVVVSGSGNGGTWGVMHRMTE
jgi:hypothetical protein